MAVNVHIEHIGDTEANVRANMDLLQIGILTDQSEEFTWYNFNASKMYYAAAQKYWNGAAIVYMDVDFAKITAHDDILVDEYIKRAAGTDDRIRFENDKITITCGGADAFVFEDDRVYSGLKKFGFGKTTIEAWDPDFVAIQNGGMVALYSTITEKINGSLNLSNNIYHDGAIKRILNDEATLYQQVHGHHSWFSDEADTADVGFTPTERMRLASNDLSTGQSILSIGKTTIENHKNIYSAIQLGGNNNFLGETTEATGNKFMMMQNGYSDQTTGNFKYISTGVASYYWQENGTHNFTCVPSGTAGDDFAGQFLALKITSLGNLLLGCNPPTANATRVFALGDNGAVNPTMAANTAGFFAKDVDAVMSPFAIDEGGGVAQLAPHDHKTWEWISLTAVTKKNKRIWKKYRMETLMNHLINLLNKHEIKDDTLFQLTEELI